MTRRDSKGRFITVTEKKSRAKKVTPTKYVDKRTIQSNSLAEALGIPIPKVPVINVVAFVRDISSSMAPYAKQLANNFDKLWTATAAVSKQLKQDTRAGVFDFNHEYFRVIETGPMADQCNLPVPRCYGTTSLYTTVSKVIDELKISMPKNASFLINVLTDGEATDHSMGHWFKDSIEDCQRLGNWTFSFQMPRGKAEAFSNLIGIPRENIREWEISESGLRETMAVTMSSMVNYKAALNTGVKSTAAFYAPVTTDLSQLNQKQVAQKLDNLASRFKSYTVEKETNVRSFVETKTGKPYVIGSAYYTLMKREEVQPQKQVLLMEKGKKTVWGGQEARDMIGLPQGKHAKVTPGNHSNYDIYVQSTSTNRILPRGTKVLVDVAQTQNLAPTWGKP